MENARPRSNTATEEHLDLENTTDFQLQLMENRDSNTAGHSRMYEDARKCLVWELRGTSQLQWFAVTGPRVSAVLRLVDNYTHFGRPFNAHLLE